jgi:hypothetical protein
LWQAIIYFVGLRVPSFDDGRACYAQNETKRRPLADLRFSPDPPSMPSDDALHNGESYPSTFKFIGAVEPLKGPKKLVCILCMKSGPVVANVDYDLVIDGHLADLDHGPLSTASEFHGIG